jgi:hypothetical protein
MTSSPVRGDTILRLAMMCRPAGAGCDHGNSIPRLAPWASICCPPGAGSGDPCPLDMGEPMTYARFRPHLVRTAGPTRTVMLSGTIIASPTSRGGGAPSRPHSRQAIPLRLDTISTVVYTLINRVLDTFEYWVPQRRLTGGAAHDSSRSGSGPTGFGRDETRLGHGAVIRTGGCSAQSRVGRRGGARGGMGGMEAGGDVGAGRPGGYSGRGGVEPHRRGVEEVPPPPSPGSNALERTSTPVGLGHRHLTAVRRFLDLGRQQRVVRGNLDRGGRLRRYPSCSWRWWVQCAAIDSSAWPWAGG